MRFFLQGADRTVSCNEQNFVAQGGEGAVYVDGENAIKIYERPELMIPAGKIAELSAIATEDILAPLGVVLRQDRPVGYWMKYASRCLPLPKIYPRSWRAKNGLDPAAAVVLVLALRNNYGHVHGEQCLVNVTAPTWKPGANLVIDGNDMNFLAREDLSGLVHIDVDSYKTASYPPTAIMESVRDPTTRDFTVETDWYSFAIVAFSLMVGIHPFKGTHPDYKPGQMLERMKDGASALLPAVRLPKPCMPLDVIPPAWRTWLKGHFHHGDRSPPPTSAAAVSVTMPKMVAATPGAIVTLTKVLGTDAPVVHLVRSADGLFASLADGSFAIGMRKFRLRGAVNPAPDAVGVTPRLRQPVGFWLSSAGGWLKGINLASGDDLVGVLRADAVVTSEDGLVHLRRGEDLLEMRYLEGDTIRAIPERIGAVAARSSSLFPGVVVQSLLGATYASLLPKAGRCVQVRLKEIEGKRLVDARFVGGRGVDGKTGVLVVAVARRGQIDLHTWSGLWAAGRFEFHELESDVGTPEINLAELDTGICIAVTADGAVRIFKPGRVGGQMLQDEALSSARLHAGGGRLLALLDDGVYTAVMK